MDRNSDGADLLHSHKLVFNHLQVLSFSTYRKSNVNDSPFNPKCKLHYANLKIYYSQLSVFHFEKIIVHKKNFGRSFFTFPHTTVWRKVLHSGGKMNFRKNVSSDAACKIVTAVSDQTRDQIALNMLHMFQNVDN